MRQFSLCRELLGAPITAQVLYFPEGLQAAIYGGTRPHIGAVSVADPDGNVATRQFPAHRDSVVSEQWARALAEAGYRPAVVTAGIHYDHLSREQIAGVVDLTDGMLSELLDVLNSLNMEIDS